MNNSISFISICFLNLIIVSTSARWVSTTHIEELESFMTNLHLFRFSKCPIDKIPILPIIAFT